MKTRSTILTDDASALLLVTAMLRFINTGIAGEPLSNAQEISGGKLRLVCIKFLRWLQARNHVPHMTASRLDSFGSGKDEVVRLVSTDPAFRSVFCLLPEGVSFLANIPDREIADILDLVARDFHPPEFVTVRPRKGVE